MSASTHSTLHSRLYAERRELQRACREVQRGAAVQRGAHIGAGAVPCREARGAEECRAVPLCAERCCAARGAVWCPGAVRRCGAARVEMRKRGPGTGPCASTVDVRVSRVHGPMRASRMPLGGGVVRVWTPRVEARVGCRGPGCPVRMTEASREVIGIGRAHLVMYGRAPSRGVLPP